MGHVPKLYNSAARYQLWRALRSDAGATVISSTLLCMVGSYSVCQQGAKAIGAKPFGFFRTFCQPFCAAGTRCPGSDRESIELARKRMLSHCRHHRHINFTHELPDMQRDTRTLRHADYLRESMAHRVSRPTGCF